MKFLVISFYEFTFLENVPTLVNEWREAFSKLEIKGRIYLSTQGVNAQLSIEEGQYDAFEKWLKLQSYLQNLFIKRQPLNQHAFEKLIVKERKELVAINKQVDPSLKGNYLTPAEWKRLLQEEKGYILIDVRNHYEYKIGHFKGAIDPNLQTFRDFSSYLEEMKLKVKKDQKVLMCCTGGIRCEIFSSMMLEQGFEDVNQLEGGIIAYGNEFGSEEFEGKLFVFDDRMAVDLDPDGKTEVISHCYFCEEKSDTYYNCANMDCNYLFLSCSHCYEKQKGCCKKQCQHSGRIRKVNGLANKPFRKWHHYFSSPPIKKNLTVHELPSE